MSKPDYILDIKGLKSPAPQGDRSSESESPSRPWIAMQWRCCGAYSRIYRNRAGNAYVGNCPKCAKPVRIKIAPGGTNLRFFEAS